MCGIIAVLRRPSLRAVPGAHELTARLGRAEAIVGAEDLSGDPESLIVELTGAPETGINVDWTPGPRGPVTYRDLWLRQYRIVGDGTQRR